MATKKSKTPATPTKLDGMISIKQAVALSGLSEQYVRKAISKGDLTVTKGLVRPDAKIPKNFISVTDFEAWRNKAGSHARREDGRNKFVIYMTADEEVKLRELIGDEAFQHTLERANQKVVATEVEVE